AVHALARARSVQRERAPRRRGLRRQLAGGWRAAERDRHRERRVELRAGGERQLELDVVARGAGQARAVAAAARGGGEVAGERRAARRVAGERAVVAARDQRREDREDRPPGHSDLRYSASASRSSSDSIVVSPILPRVLTSTSCRVGALPSWRYGG